MCKETLFRTLFVLAALIIGSGQTFGAVITSNTTWNNASQITDGETVTVNGGTLAIPVTLTVNADMTDDGAVLDALILGKTTTTPASSGTGTVVLTDQAKLQVEKLQIGGDYDGYITIDENAYFFIQDEIALNGGTLTNHGSQNWSSRTITWGSGTMTFNGTGTTNLGSYASGQTLILESGTLRTSGSLDADSITLTGGTLQVAGQLTLSQNLTDAGTTIELLDSGSWKTDSSQIINGHVIVSGGTLTLESDLDYSSTTGTLSMSDGTINLDDYDLNLGDRANSFDITGGSFTADTLGGSTISWSAGTIDATVHTFFSTYYIDNVNVSLSDTAVLNVYEGSDGDYAVVYNLTMTDDSTVTGEDMLLYVQAGASITTTSGVNTADLQFMGRADQSTVIGESGVASTAQFTGDIDIYNGVLNYIYSGTYDGEVTITNPGDTSTGVEDVPVGVGLTQIHGGTFNNLVTLDLYREELDDDEEDLENKVNIYGGTFNDTIQFTGAGNARIWAGDYFHSLQLTNTATGTFTIAGDTTFAESVSGTSDSVIITGGELYINSGITLTAADGALLAENGTGLLNGKGNLIGDLGIEGGTLSGSLAITGNVSQSGGLIAPGINTEDAEAVGTITIDGTLALHDTQIKLGLANTCDKLEVTGNITTTDDGTMTVIALNDDTKPSTGDYTVLESTTGTIDIDEDYTLTSGITGYKVSGNVLDRTGGGKQYVVTLSRSINTFPRGAYNANRFANYLYELIDEEDPQTVLTNALASASNQQLAAEKLSGEPHLDSLQALMNVGIMRNHVLTNHIRPNRHSMFFSNAPVENDRLISRGQQLENNRRFEQVGLWYTGYGMGGHITGNENTSPFGVTFAGMMVGIEGTYDGGSGKVGLYYDNSHTETDASMLVAKTNIDTNFFGAYMSHELSTGYRLFTFGFGEDRYQARRSLDIGSGNDRLSEIARSGYHGWQTTFYGERGFDLTGRWERLQPYLGLQYSYIRRNAFEETGAQYTGLDMNAESYDSLRTYLGARWNTPFFQIGQELKTGRPLGGFVQFQSVWIHEMLNKTAPICGAHLGATTVANNFLVEGADCGRDWWLGSVGTQWRLAKAFSFYGDYTILVNGRQTFHTGSGGVCLSW